MTIRRALRLSTLLGCMVASLVYARAQEAATSPTSAAPAAAQPTTPTVSDQSAKNIRFQFDGIPYMTVVERFAQMAGKPLLLDTGLEGTLKFSDPDPYDYDEALDTLNLILSMKDVMLVEQDRYLRLMPLSKLKQTPLKVLRNLEERGDVRPGEIVTVALNFKNLDPNEIAQSTTTMLSNAGSVFPTGRGKGIIITDRVENIERIQKLLSLADVAPPMERQMKTFNIVSASGPVLTDLINRTFGIATAPVKSRYNQEKNLYMPLPPSPEDYVTAVWDEASRTMVVFGPNERVSLAEELINRFESKDGVAPSEVRIFYPVEMGAQELSRVIRQTVSGVADPKDNADTAATKARLVVDERLGRLIVTTPVAGQMESIEAVIKKVDPSALGEPGVISGTPSEMKIFYPKRMTATELSEMIRQTVSGIAAPKENVSTKTRLVVDTKMERLIVVSPDPKQIQTITDFIEKVDSVQGGSIGEIGVGIKMIYPSQMTATELSDLVRKALPEIADPAENALTASQKIRLSVDTKKERLIVMAPSAEQLAKVQEVVKTLDSGAGDLDSGSGKAEMKMFYPIMVTPTELDAMVRQAVKEIAAPTESVSQKARLIVDNRLGRLIVITANAEVLKNIEDVIAKVDSQSGDASAAVDMKIFYPKKVTPAELSTLLRQMVTGIAAPGENAPNKVRLVVDTVLERVVVITGDAKKMAEIELAASKIDSLEGDEESEAGTGLDKSETAVVRLEYAVATELGGLVTKTFGERRSGLKVMIDDRSNSLVLNGKSPVVSAAREVIKDLDVESSSVTGRQIRFLEVQGDVYRLASLASQLLAEQSRNENSTKNVQEQRRMQRLGAPRIIPEPYTGRLIISGTDDELDQIKKIVEEIDLQNGGSTGIKVFRLRGNNPYEVSTILRGYLNTYREKRKGGPSPTVFVDGHNNSLVVCGTVTDIQQASTLIEQIDTNQDREPRVIKIFPVRQDVYEQMTRLRTLYTDQLKANPQAGAPDAVFLPDYGSSSVTVAASESQMKIVENLLTLLQGDDLSANAEFRQFQLIGTNPDIVYGALQSVFARENRGRGSRPWIQPDWSSNKIFFYGRPADVAKAEDIINQLDGTVSADNPREMKVFTVKAMDSWGFSMRVEQLFREQTNGSSSSSSAKGRNALFLGDAGRLIVVAERNQMPIIQNIIDVLNEETAVESELCVFKLKFADVRNIYPMVQHVTMNRGGYRTRGVAPAITLDTQRNSLSVYGRPADIAQVKMIIEKLDSTEMEQSREMKTYRITSRNVNGEISRIRTLYESQRQARPEVGASDPIFLPDNEFSRMTVAATKEQIELIDEIIAKLDDKSALPDMQLRLLQPTNGNNTQIAEGLNFVIRARRTQRTGSQPWISPDERTGGIFVFGMPEDIKYAEELLKEFDSVGEGLEREVRTYDIQYAGMAQFAANVRSLYMDQMKGNSGLGSPDAFIQGDDYAGKLIVSVRKTQLDLLDGIITTLKEKSDAAEPTVRLYPLKSARPSQLAPVLNTVIYSRTQRGTVASRVTADDINNRIIVSGSTGEVERIGKLIEQLDVAEVRDARALRVFDVKTWDVWSYSTRLQQLYRDQVKGLTDAGPADAIILPDDFSGRLIVAANEKQMPLIEGIMQSLESELPERQLELRTYKLENVYTSQAIRTINTLMQGGGRFGMRFGRPGDRDTLTMSADEKNNTIVAMGSSSKLEQLENIIKTIDQKPEKPDREVRFYTLVNADSLDVELRLDDMFNDKARPEQIIFESDFLANTLTVVAREADFAEIEEMIEKMDSVSRDLTEIVRLIPINNMSAEQMSKVLENIYPQVSAIGLEIVDKLPPRSGDSLVGQQGFKAKKDTEVGGEIQTPSEMTQTPNIEDMKVILAVDANANTLIVSGPSFEVDRIRSIVSQLQSSFASGDSEIRMFKLKEADPVIVARTLTELFKTSGPTNAESQQSQGRRRNRQQGTGTPTPTTPQQQAQPQGQPPGQPQAGQPGMPPVPRAIIVPETRTRSIIVRTKPSDFVALESLIKQLDAEGIDELLQHKMLALENAMPAQVLRIVNQVVDQLDIVTPGDPIAIAADDRTRSLFIIARDVVLQKIEQIVKELDEGTESAEIEVKVYPLKYVSGTQMGVLLQNLFASGTVRAGIAPQRGAAQGGADAVRRLKFKDDSGKEIFLDLAHPIKIITDNSTSGINRVIVGATQSNLAGLDEVIRQLDRELPQDMNGVRILTLQNADATVLATSLQRLISERVRQQRGPSDEIRTVIIADTRSNSLIIGGSNANMELVQDLAEQLDSAETALMNNIRLIPLEYATAQRLSGTLTTLFQRRTAGAGRWGGGQANRTVIIPDVRSNSLLVAASQEDDKLIDELLAKLDKPMANENLEPVVIPLEQNDSTRLAATIRSIFAARLQALAQAGQQPDPQDRVNVEADTLSNSLIVTANKDNLEVVQGLVKRLDQEPSAEGLVQTITLKYADVQRVSTMLRTLIQQGVYRPGASAVGRRGGSQRDSFAVTVDVPSNTLIISASPENMALAKELIGEIDTADNKNASDVKTFALKHARVDRLVTTLDQFFRNKSAAEQRAGVRERAMSVTMAADSRSNVLLVTAGKEDLELLEKMLNELDVKDADSQVAFNIYPLKNSTASKMQTTLQRLFQNRPSRARGVAAEPITIVADAWSNALIIGTSPDDEEMVKSLIDQLDMPENASLKVQVFPMKHADARRVATTVQSLLRGQTGATYGSGTGPTVSVDERINAIVVSAGENDIKRLDELVKKLDTPMVERVNEIRIFPLSYARAAEMATILNSTLNGNPQNLTQSSASRQSMFQFITRTPEGKDLVSSALREGVLITSDPRSNSLVVSAPVDYMEFLESMVKSMDQSSPQEAKIRIFSLKNADARQMATVLTALFRLQATTGAASQRSVQYTLVKPNEDMVTDAPENSPDSEVADDSKSAVVGSAEQHALTVTIDLRTNTVLVGGTEHYVSLASEIIETLDAHPAQERKAEVYRLKNSRAADIESALRTFLQQDLNRTISILGQSAAGAAQSILDREVSIVAETVSNTLLISASPRYFGEVEQLIEQLDQPQPQVLIQVIVAEVTLDSTTELGVEWKYVDSAGGTPFSVGSDFGVADALKSFGGFSTAVSGSKVNFLLRALQNDGRLEVLSRPQILTADNIEANINISDQMPIVTGTTVSDYGNTYSTYEYRDVGVILNVTPRISPDGMVKMEVHPEVSQKSSSTIEINGDAIPIISQRSATTTVSVQSGQSVLIGGLISTADDSRTKKVPWIGNIPVLGALFRSKSFESTRKELIIILSPQVITAQAPMETNSLDVLDMTRDGLSDSILKNDLGSDPLQRKVLKNISPLLEKDTENVDQEAEEDDAKKENESKKIVRKNYTKELLIDP